MDPAPLLIGGTILLGVIVGTIRRFRALYSLSRRLRQGAPKRSEGKP